MTLPLAELSDEEVVSACLVAHDKYLASWKKTKGYEDYDKYAALRAELLRRMKANRPETGKGDVTELPG